MCGPPPDIDDGPRFRSPEDDWALPMTEMEQYDEDKRPREDA